MGLYGFVSGNNGESVGKEQRHKMETGIITCLVEVRGLGLIFKGTAMLGA